MQDIFLGAKIMWKYQTMKIRSKATAACTLFFMCLLYHIFISWFSRSLQISTSTSTSGTIANLAFRPDSMFSSYFRSPQAQKLKCHKTNKFYDLCLVNGPTVLDPTTSTFYVVDSAVPAHQTNTSEKIRPYPRKWEHGTMRDVKEFTLTAGLPGPPCKIRHNAPALVFSVGSYITVGGFAGNFFHEFNDGIVPLFVTVNTVFSNDQDFIFAVADARDTWFEKYSDLLHAYSKHPVINLDNQTSTHCFTSVSVGLITHGFMTIKPRLMPMSKTIFHFRSFLDKAYGQGLNKQARPNYPKRPKLILTRRTGSVGRVLLNHKEVKKMAEDIGFEVIVFQPSPKTPLRECYKLVSSSHAVVGVHGAALTHTVFLRPGAVFLQVVPLGVDIGADIFFGDYARAIGLEYMEYKIKGEESSLINRFDKNSQLIRDPIAYLEEHRSVATNDLFFKEQDVKLDLARFKKYIVTAYEKALNFMEKEG